MNRWRVSRASKLKYCLVLGAAALTLSAGPVGGAGAKTVRVPLKDAQGKPVGEARVEQKRGGVQISAQLSNLPPGTYGFHIHETGKCEPPFETAGKHFNPWGKKHGRNNPEGAHAGDLPNIKVSADGRATVDVFAGGVTLGEGKGNLLDDDGSALVVHEKPDDYKSDPAGQAGARIACGVITQQNARR